MTLVVKSECTKHLSATQPVVNDNNLAQHRLFSLPVPVVLVDEHNRIDHINTAAERLTGKPHQPGIVNSWSDLIAVRNQRGVPVRLLPSKMLQGLQIPGRDTC